MKQYLYAKEKTRDIYYLKYVFQREITKSLEDCFRKDSRDTTGVDIVYCVIKYV